MRPSLALLAIALVLAPLALSMMGSAAAAPTLSATRAGTTMTLTIHGATDGSGAIRVDHVDAFAGRVLDRLASVAWYGNGTTQLILDGLRADEPLRVQLVDASGAVLATRDVPPAAGSRTVLSPKWDALVLANNDQLNNNEIHMLVTDAGVLVLAWRNGTDLVMETSNDSGHSFSAPFRVIQTTEGEAMWAMAESAPGRVTIAFHAIEVAGHLWRFRTVDLASRSVVASTNVQPAGEGNVTWYRMEHGLAVDRDGTAIEAVSDATNIVQLIRVHPNGQVDEFASVDVGQPAASPFVTVNGSRMGIAAGRFGTPNHGVSLTLSTNGGGTWTMPQHVTIPDDVQDEYLSYLVPPTSTADGSLHLAFGMMKRIGSTPHEDGYYVHLGTDGSLLRQWRLNNESTSAITPLVAARGDRLWLWSHLNRPGSESDALQIMESLDAGTTWGQAYNVQPEPLGFVGDLNARPPPAILPSGRPVLLGSDPDVATDGATVHTILPFDPELRSEPPIVNGPASPARTPAASLVIRAPPFTNVTEGNVTLVFVVSNDGDLAGDANATFAVDGVARASTHVHVEAGSATNATFTWDYAVGDHEVLASLSTGGSAGGTLHVTPKAQEPGPPPPSPLVGEAPADLDVNASASAKASLTLRNPNEVAVGANVTFSADGEVVGLIQLDVAAHGERVVTQAVPQLGAGDHVLVWAWDASAVATSLHVHPDAAPAPTPPTAPTLVTPTVATPTVATPTAATPSVTTPTVATATPSIATATPSAPSRDAEVNVRVSTNVAVAAAGIAAGVGAAAVGVALVVRTDVGRTTLGLVSALPLYTRIAPRDVLRNDVRAGVHAYIAAHPGTRYEEMRVALALANGSLAFHLRVLTREGYVRVTREWTRRRYYTQSGMVAIAPRSSAADAVVERVRNAGALTAAELARELDISRQLARYHLEAQVRAGALERMGPGSGAPYRAVGGARSDARVRR